MERELLLTLVCDTGDFDRARQLISQGYNPKSAKDSGGWTPLHWGCWWGDLSFVRTLVEDHSCDPESRTTSTPGWTLIGGQYWSASHYMSAGSTPLHVASQYVPLLITCM